MGSFHFVVMLEVDLFFCSRGFCFAPLSRDLFILLSRDPPMCYRNFHKLFQAFV